MVTHSLVTAMNAASETEKARFADFLLTALDDLLPQDDATKRRLVAAMDRFADEGADL